MRRVELRDLLKVAREEFGDIVGEASVLGEVRLRLVLKDGSTIDILYPRRDKYSFHWTRKNGIVRINTAPHHPGPTYPRHVHSGSEENVVPKRNLPRGCARGEFETGPSLGQDTASQVGPIKESETVFYHQA